MLKKFSMCLMLGTALFVAGCSSTKTNQPTLPVQEEKAVAENVAPVVEKEPEVKKERLSVQEEADVRKYFLDVEINMTGFQQGLNKLETVTQNPALMSYDSLMESYDIFTRMYSNMDYNPIPQVNDKEVQQILNDVDLDLRLTMNGVISSTFSMALSVEMGDVDGVGKAGEDMQDSMKYMDGFTENVNKLRAILDE